MCACVYMCAHHISTPVAVIALSFPDTQHSRDDDALRVNRLTLDHFVLCCPFFFFWILHFNVRWNVRTHCTFMAPITCFGFSTVWIIYCLLLKCVFIRSLMTRPIMPVNTFIAVDWTQGPPIVKCNECKFSLECTTMYKDFIIILMSTWVLRLQDFCASFFFM